MKLASDRIREYIDTLPRGAGCNEFHDAERYTATRCLDMALKFEEELAVTKDVTQVTIERDGGVVRIDVIPHATFRFGVADAKNIRSLLDKAIKEFEQ